MGSPNHQATLLPEHFIRVFSANKNKTALSFIDSQYRYAELLEGAQLAAGWLRQQGLQPGDRIAVQMIPAIEPILFYLASLLYGTILVPLNPGATLAEIEYYLADASVSLYISARDSEADHSTERWQVLLRDNSDNFRSLESIKTLMPAIEKATPFTETPTPEPDQTALLCYTSGTTGKPKGAMITQGNLAAMAISLNEAWGWQSADVLLHTLPLFHVHGLLVALQGALYAGACTIRLPRFETEAVLIRLAKGDCTLFMGVPTMYNRFVSTDHLRNLSLKNMRLFTSGSAPLSIETFQAFQNRFGHTVLERYGMTEAGMVLSNPLNGERKAGSVGLPLPWVSVRIVDPETGDNLPQGETGELYIKSNSVCLGYWQRPEATKKTFTPEAWFKSGDMARQDSDGYYYLVGRQKELIITGGFNVYPREIEQVLEKHPAVLEAALFGREDKDLGERVCAAVVPDPESGVTEEDLIKTCRASLSAYKCPKNIFFLKSLPRNSMGKVLKDELKTRL